jgi:Holliday junction resolvasome RuvABC endonuclease subunit
LTIVVGIDPGMHGLHAAMVHVEEDELVLAQVKANNNRFKLASAVLSYLFAETGLVIQAAKSRWPDEETLVFIEEPLVAGARNIRTALKMSQAVGAMVAGVGIYTDKCYLVPVSTWKKAVIGNGSASKEQVALWLSRHHPSYSSQCDGSQDLTDACCIARFGVGVHADAALVRTIGRAGEL